MRWSVRVIAQQALRPDLEPGFEAALAVNVDSAFSHRVLRRAARQREPLGNQFVQSHAFAWVGSQSGVETERFPALHVRIRETLRSRSNRTPTQK